MSSDQQKQRGPRWYQLIEEQHKDHPSWSRTFRVFTDKGEANTTKSALEKSYGTTLVIQDFSPRGRQ